MDTAADIVQFSAFYCILSASASAAADIFLIQLPYNFLLFLDKYSTFTSNNNDNNNNGANREFTIVKDIGSPPPYSFSLSLSVFFLSLYEGFSLKTVKSQQSVRYFYRSVSD